MASTQHRDLRCEYSSIRRLHEMEKSMKEQVDQMSDAEKKQTLESALAVIVKTKEDLWKGFNNSLKLTLEMNSIRAFRVEEALETPQEWDVMAILMQYLCPDTPNSAAVDPDSVVADPDSAAADPDSEAADPDSAAADPDSAEENRNWRAPNQNFYNTVWSWILARGTTVGNFAAAVAELWFLMKVSEFFAETAVPQIDTNIVNPTSSTNSKLPFATVVAQKGLQQILEAVKLDV